MITAQDVWNELNRKNMLDEEGKNWNVGNTVMNFARDVDALTDEERNLVLRTIIGYYGDGSVTITSNPENWVEITDGLWQSKEDPTMFSTDGGKTYYSCNDSEHRIHTAVASEVPQKETETAIA